MFDLQLEGTIPTAKNKLAGKCMEGQLCLTRMNKDCFVLQQRALSIVLRTLLASGLA